MDRKLLANLAILIIILLSFFLRLWPLQKAHWWDETVYLQNAETIFFGRTNFDELQIRPPIISVIFGLGFLVSHNVFTAGIIAALISSLAVLFIYLIGKEMYNEVCGLLSAAILAFTQFFITISHWLMTDMPSITFILASFYFLAKGSKKNQTHQYIISGVLFTLALLTRFTTVVLIFPLLFFLYINKISRKKISYFLASLAVSAAPYFLWVQLKYGFFLHTFIWANAVVGDQVGNILYYFTSLLDYYPAFAPIFISALSLTAVLLFLGHSKRIKLNFSWKFGKNTKFLLFWFVFFIAYISITPHKEPRDALSAMLPFILLVYSGLSSLFMFRRKAASLPSIALFLILAFYLFSPSFLKFSEPIINMQLTGPMIGSEYINSLNRTASMLYVNEDHPVYAYYTGLKITILSFDPEFYKKFPGNMKHDGFFAFDKESKKDPDKEWLDSNKQFRLLKDTGRIIVYEYKAAQG